MEWRPIEFFFLKSMQSLVQLALNSRLNFYTYV